MHTLQSFSMITENCRICWKKFRSCFDHFLTNSNAISGTEMLSKMIITHVRWPDEKFILAFLVLSLFTTVFVDTGATLENKTPAKTFTTFPSVMLVIDRSDQNPPITATTVTFRPSLCNGL